MSPGGGRRPGQAPALRGLVLEALGREAIATVGAADGIGLVAALDDPLLLGGSVSLWPRQRDLLRDVERYWGNVWALGRRSGKSMMAAAALCWDALLRPDLDALVQPGERRYSVVVATKQEQAQIVLRAARSFLEASPALRQSIETVTENEILLRDGGAIAAFACSSRGGRGYPISMLVLDEVAHFLDTEGNASADSVLRALAPSLTQFGDQSRLILSSSPNGAEGLFADWWQRATNGEIPGTVAHRFGTAEMNPEIDLAFLEAQRAIDPEWFRSEYGAEFVDGGGQYLDSYLIDAAVRFSGDLSPTEGLRWVAGLDPAFSRDPFGLVIVGQDPDDWRRLKVGCVRAWRPGRTSVDSFEGLRASQDEILAEVASICRYYGVERIVTDVHLAPQIVRRLREEGFRVDVVPMSGTRRIQGLQDVASRLRTETLDIPDDPDLKGELRRLRTRYTGGSMWIENPRVPGSHGDLVDALVLAVWGHRFFGDPQAMPSVGGFPIEDRFGVSWEPIRLDDVF